MGSIATRRTARVTGLLYLLTVVLDIVAEVVIAGRLVVADSGTTASCRAGWACSP